MAMQQNTDHIQTTHIGSLPRPQKLLGILKAKYADQPYDETTLQSILAQAARRGNAAGGAFGAKRPLR
jgi:5-methyltetrahydropteroyltriglutamate--homocysteine methyltransferase